MHSSEIMDINDSSVHETAILSKESTIGKIFTTDTYSSKGSCFPSVTWRSTLAQSFATYVNGLCFLSLGLMFSIQSVVIADIQNAKNGLTLNDEQVSWYASLLPIFQPFGCFVGGILQNHIGRKYGLLLMNVSTVIAWMTLYEVTSVGLLYVSSALMGISMGLAQTPCVTYVCEIATPKLRGTLVTYNDSNVVFGVMLTYLLAVFWSWKTSSLICMGLPILSVVLILFIPDSPVWLIEKGRTREAIKALQWLRGWVPEAHVMPEIEELRHFITKRSYANQQNVDPACEKKSRLSQLLEAATLRPFFLLFFYSFFAFAASTQAARNYYLVIFNSLNLPMDSERLAFLYSLSQLFGGLVCAATVKVLGKRSLSLMSMISCSVLTILLGLYMLFDHRLKQPSIFIVSFILLGFAQTIGISTIPWVLMGEVFPVKTRSVAVGITGAAYYACITFYVKTYHLLMVTRGTFVVYGVLGIVGALYLWIFMPETEGKSMAEIEELFADGARKKCPHFRHKK